jgi:hypothetical protein
VRPQYLHDAKFQPAQRGASRHIVTTIVADLTTYVARNARAKTQAPAGGTSGGAGRSPPPLRSRSERVRLRNSVYAGPWPLHLGKRIRESVEVVLRAEPLGHVLGGRGVGVVLRPEHGRLRYADRPSITSTDRGLKCYENAWPLLESPL